MSAPPLKPATEFVSAPPVFFLNKDAPEHSSVAELCEAAEKITGFASIAGCQRIGQVWRLYPVSLEIRARLVGQKLLVRDHSILLSSLNPLSFRDGDGNEIPSTRLVIDGVYASINNTDFEGYLVKAGAKLRSPLFWERERLESGALTRWFTGRRIVWIDLPDNPLPLAIRFGSQYASLYYR